MGDDERPIPGASREHAIKLRGALSVTVEAVMLLRDAKRAMAGGAGSYSGGFAALRELVQAARDGEETLALLIGEILEVGGEKPQKIHNTDDDVRRAVEAVDRLLASSEAEA